MIELRGIRELEANGERLRNLPIQVKVSIQTTLQVLDEEYGAVPEQRTLQGGRAIILEHESEAAQVHTIYNISCNEFVDEIVTDSGIVYLNIVLIHGTENSIAIFAQEKFIRPYLKQ